MHLHQWQDAIPMPRIYPLQMAVLAGKSHSWGKPSPMAVHSRNSSGKRYTAKRSGGGIIPSG